MAVTLWGRAKSANVQKVRWALAEIGLAYEHVPLGGRYGGNKDSAYLAMNPNGLVPTLRDGDVIMWESHTILRYLAATYSAGELWPESTRARAVADQWTDWTAATFQPLWIDAFWRIVRTPEAQRDLAAITKTVRATERCFEIMEERLAVSRCLAGDALTYANWRRESPCSGGQQCPWNGSPTPAWKPGTDGSESGRRSVMLWRWIIQSLLGASRFSDPRIKTLAALEGSERSDRCVGRLVVYENLTGREHVRGRSW